MAWYDRFIGRTPDAEEKLNPAQQYYDHSTAPSREFTLKYEKAYEDIEIVNRGVNLIVDDASEIKTTVGEQIQGLQNIVKGVKRSKVRLLLNKEPNPFQDISTFKRNLLTDYLIDGNIFVYFDGVHLYHLPANKVNIHSSKTTYIEKFTFNETVDYKPSEIIHIKDNSFYSIYRGISRLKPALRTMILMQNMRQFQDNFFKNGAVPGLVLKSPNTLSEKIKERMLQAWQTRYNPKNGGKRPLILDGGLEVDALTKVNFKELDFQSSITANEKIILEAMGVPPILLDGGNNANIRPNHRLYYLETVLPIVKKVSYAFERYFGYKLIPDVTDIPALQPELRDQASYYQTLVNSGIMTPNEARDSLNLPPIEGNDDIRVPANVAGSAANPEEGGRPPQTEEEDNGE